ncbi:MAG: primosomal protein N' [Candidatus Saccharimonas sp.]
MHYYEVAPTKIVRAAQATFTYHSESPLSIGQIVHVPIGSTQLVGVVVAIVSKKPPYATKPITDVVAVPTLPLPIMHTAQWMAHYYATHFATVLQTILPTGIDKKRRPKQTTAHNAQRDRTHFLLNEGQSNAVSKINAMNSGTALLHGITGSGKTAVYIELARQTVEQGRSVIVLVPEIALTSQIVAEFQHHFNEIVLVHSRQSESDRHIAWQNVAESTTPFVVIGPRSALFMPLRSVGLIIIDEAHEPSFRQDQSPKYSALRVASILAQQHQARVVQGSATPLVAEYYAAINAGCPIITMNSKAQTSINAVTTQLVDMTKKESFSKHHLFSNTLIEQLSATLAAKQQSLLFHNRRGSAAITRCKSCGWSSNCERCFVPLTLHADRHVLLCHICGIKARVPTSCPTCHQPEIIHRGIGTKLIESELRKLFPKASIARFDGDTAMDSTLEKRYQELYDGAIDIIIGTQVVAKGLDLPHLRTVGIIQADAGLSLPDYTASERTFQLIAQVLGRVGRTSHPSNVIIQSYTPTAPSVEFGTTQNYKAFYDHTLAERQRAMFPPFCYLLKLTCSYKTEQGAVNAAQQLAIKLREKFPNLTILGPTPAFYERQHGTYRWQLVVKSARRADLAAVLDNVPNTQWQADLDPLSLL